MDSTSNGASLNAHKRKKLLTCLTGRPILRNPGETRPVIGVLKGNGIGPEVIDVALRVLKAVEERIGLQCELRYGGCIGEEAEARADKPLPEPVVQFCREIFEADGAILNGPGGGRYVYDLRQRFDLFCKFVPVQPWPQLSQAGRIVARHLQHVDMLIVRDNIGGIYQGTWGNVIGEVGRVAEHTFSYNELQVYRLVEVATRAAAQRRGRLHIIVKDGGVPGISQLWREVGLAIARKHSIKASIMNVDLAAYELIQNPAQFDVLVAPNMIGDILADIAGVLVASRGLTFSGNYTPTGDAVYQTNHGCAHDLAGTDTANPAGQILSLAMMLRETFGLDAAADLIEESLAEAWQQGWRTADIAEPGTTVLGTRAMGERIVEQILRRVEVGQTA